MISKAEVKFIRLSPTKVRQVMDLIRNKSAVEAQSILFNLNKRPKVVLIKLLKSAVSNAKIKGFKEEDLIVSKIICNVGPTWKRFKAASFGRAAPILKRTSHMKIELDVRK